MGLGLEDDDDDDDDPTFLIYKWNIPHLSY